MLFLVESGFMLFDPWPTGKAYSPSSFDGSEGITKEREEEASALLAVTLLTYELTGGAAHRPAA